MSINVEGNDGIVVAAAAAAAPAPMILQERVVVFGWSEEETSHNNEEEDPPAAAEETAARLDATSSCCSRFRSVHDLAEVLKHDDPDRMKLTHEEHQWALNIKETIESMPDMDNLSDFQYAQLALVCEDGDMEDIIHRCYGLQDFRQEYKVISDQLNEGCKNLQTLFKIFPEVYLSFSFSEEGGTYVTLLDISRFEPTNFLSPLMVEEWLKACYYWCDALFPDFESIRKGIIVLVECQEVSIIKRDVLKHFSALFSQLMSNYPMNGKFRHYNSGAMMNVLASILRQLLPKHMKDGFEVGLKFEGNLRHAFLTPTVAEANQRMLGRMQESLKHRYSNEKAFTL